MSLPRPGYSRTTDPARKTRGWAKILSGVGFAALVAGAAWVVFGLPGAMRSSADRPVRTAQETTPTAPSPDLRSTISDPPPRPQPETRQTPPTGKAGADAARHEALRLQAALENADAPDWAGKRFVTSYPEAMAVLGKANEVYRQGNYAAARPLYDEAVGKFREIGKNKPRRLRQALDQGTAALGRLDTITAEESYRAALAVDPDNDEAQKGLERVRNLRQAVAATRNAQSLLDDGKPEEARKLFRVAVAADPGYEPAQLGLQRTEFEIGERRFKSLMSKAIAALQEKRYLASGKALDKAAKLRPEDKTLLDLRERLVAARKGHALHILEATAQRFAADEAWDKAVEQYRRALRIDPAAGFAVDGLARSEKMAKLYRGIDFYLAHPGRLQSKGPLANAEALLAAANAVTPAGRELAGKRDRLSALLKVARAPVPVTILSDGKTAVTVYRVARFGTFTRHRVELVPGEYTAVGSRNGYRDVRVTFVVPMRSAGLTVKVRCKEPI